jgi:hypothetical protein
VGNHCNRKGLFIKLQLSDCSKMQQKVYKQYELYFYSEFALKK